MSYQVLARKWRPRSFSEMVGQTHVLKALINALDSQRLHHAYLFTGTRGVGKTTIARIIAKCLNCKAGITSTPCGTCPVCREIDEGRFVDLIEIDAASRTKVEDTRELLDNVLYSPSHGRFKVYLIDEVHMLSSHSFNALLKTLEEPPPYVKFILATTDPQKLPATILSRCLQFSLKNMTPERVVKHLMHVLGIENVPFEEDALWLLGRAADGSMRDAMSLTDQAIAFGEGKVMAADVRTMLGTLDHGQVFDVLHALTEGDAKALLEAVRHLSEQGPDWSGVLSEILNVLHRVAIAQMLPEETDSGHGDYDCVLALAQALPSEDVQFYYQMGLIGRRDLPLAPDPRSGFEMVLLRMLAFRPADSAGAPSQLLKPVGISQGRVGAAKPVVDAAVVAPVVAAPEPVAETEPGIEPELAPVVDLPWNNRIEAKTGVEQKLAVEVIGEQFEMTPMPATPDSLVQAEPEWVPAPVSGLTIAQVDAATPGIDLYGEQLLEDYTEPDIDLAYSHLHHLASGQTAEPIPEPQAELAAASATGLAFQWLELFPKLPISGMTRSIAANCMLISVEGDHWLLHLDPAHSALFNLTQQRRLNDALNQHHERTLTIAIELIKPSQETPAEAAIRWHINRQREAQESIQADPLVQQIVQQFGAVVRQDTIEPVKAPGVQAS